MKIISILAIIVLLQILSHGVTANEPPRSSYNENKAKAYLLLSYASYCPAEEINAWNCSRCLLNIYPEARSTQVIYSPETDTQAYVGIFNDTVFVAFRGSMDISSWITNLKFLQVPYPKESGALVHEGFYSAWLSVQSQVQETLTTTLKSCPECTSIIITGHSLGAALSTLCMADVVDWFPNIPTELLNYGSPRVGNSVFSTYFNSIQSNVYRVTNQHDLVPHVPPQDGLVFYEHIPTEVWFSTNTSYKVCNFNNPEDPSCSDSVNPLTYSIYDHLHYFNEHCCCGN